jgi:hypothetical protein
MGLVSSSSSTTRQRLEHAGEKEQGVFSGEDGGRARRYTPFLLDGAALWLCLVPQVIMKTSFACSAQRGPRVAVSVSRLPSRV